MRCAKVQSVSRAEREAHENAGHANYRPWCKACVAGRGRSRYHRRIRKGSASGMPVVSLDYGFLGPHEKRCDGDEPSILITFLALRDREARRLAGLAVPAKGVEDPYAVTRVIKLLDEWGHTVTALRSDGEPAIEAVKRAIKERRHESTALETVPRGDHAANGDAESAVQAIAGMTRTLKVALEEKIGERIASTNPVLLWALEYGAVVHNLFKVGEDGRTAYERGKGGRKFKRQLVPFGQKVLYEHRPVRHPRDGAHLGKLEARFEEGVFLGISMNSMEYLVGDRSGDVVTTNVVKGFPDELQWDAAWIRNIKGTPWEPRPSKNRKYIQEEAAAEQAGYDMPQAPEMDSEAQRRGTYVTRRLVARYGKTKGCPGCWGHGAHSEVCRARIEELIMEEGDEARAHVEARRAMRNAAVRVEQQTLGGREELGKGSKKRRIQQEPPPQQATSSAAPAAPAPTAEPQHPTCPTVHSPSPAATQRGERRLREDESASNTEDCRPQKRGRKEDGNAQVIEEMREVMAALAGRPDVAEAYSPPRVAQEAMHMGLRPGFVLDLSVMRESGEPWDFTNECMRDEARRMVGTTRPRLLIGSPPGTIYSELQRLSTHERGQVEAKRLMVAANTHLLFCKELYLMQAARGDYFLHEHPRGAVSWHHSDMEALMRVEGVKLFVGHTRAHDVPSQGERGSALAFRPTSWLTNSEYIGDEVSRRCPNLDGAWWEKQHRQIALRSGRAKACGVHPVELCRAVLRGLARQLAADGAIARGGLGLVCDDKEEVAAVNAALNRMDTLSCLLLKDRTVDVICTADDSGEEVGDPGKYFDHPHSEDFTKFYEGSRFFDDITGNELDPEGVIEARRLELEFVDSWPVYEEVPVEQCWERTGKPPLGTKWVDVNKGGGGGPGSPIPLGSPGIPGHEERRFLCGDSTVRGPEAARLAGCQPGAPSSAWTAGAPRAFGRGEQEEGGHSTHESEAWIRCSGRA